jgi:ParB/RepB/Spo0J family partition protein
MMSSSTIGDIKDIPLEDIFADEQFNCRGRIAPMDVLDLVRDIEENGLQNPIIVQPFDKMPGKKFRIVAGYRRHQAYVVLSKSENGERFKQIPALVRPGLSELDARRINLQENLIRKQLNIQQEATAILPFKRAGWTEGEVAEQFQQSRGWVQIRYMLLSLHPDIQKDAAAGLLTQENIRQIYSLPESKRLEGAKELKERRARGEKRVLLKEPKKRDPLLRKVPDKKQIEDMIEVIGRVVGMGFHTRLLAWCAGNISDLELMRDFEEYCEENGFEYKVPPEMEAALYSTGDTR